jgi:flagellar protein FliO/FliZ
MRLTRPLLKLLLVLVVFGSISLSPVATAEAADCLNVGQNLTDECKEQAEDSEETWGFEQDSASSDEVEAVPFGNQDSGFLTLLKLIGSLALIIALIYGLLRFLSKRTKTFRQSQLLENIGGVPLGPNRSVQLIKVGNRVLVVGVGESIQLLTEIDSEEEQEQLFKLQSEQEQHIQVPAQKAMDWMKSKMSRSETHSLMGQSESNKHSSFQELFSKKLQEASQSQQDLEKVL